MKSFKAIVAGLKKKGIELSDEDLALMKDSLKDVDKEKVTFKKPKKGTKG